MRVLALDLSLRSSGWFINKRACGLLQPPPNLSFPAKLVFFRQELEKLINKYRPEVVVIEDIHLRHGNVQTLKQLAKLSGVATEVAASHGAAIELLTATQARKYCCGHQAGPFKKKDVFLYFQKKYGWSNYTFAKQNDLTDAAALYWGYHERASQPQSPSDARD